MQINVSFNEIAYFVKKKSGKDIKFKYISPNKLSIDFIISVEVALTSLSGEVITLSYSMNSLAEMMAKGTIKSFFEKIDPQVASIDTSKREIVFNLAGIDALSSFLEDFYVDSIAITEQGIMLDLKVK